MIGLYRKYNLSQRGLLIILIGRMIALSIILFCNLYLGMEVLDFKNSTSHFIEFLYGALFAISVVQVYLVVKNKYLNLVGLGQLSIDVVLLTYIASITQTGHAFALYVVLIGCASLLLNAYSSVVLAALCGLCYGFLVNQSPATNLSSGVEIILAYSTLVVSALMGAFYSKQVEGLRSFISKQEKEIEKISKDHIRLIDSFTEGIITLDLDSAITGINQAAKTILGLAENSDSLTLGRKIDEALESTRIIDPGILAKLEIGETAEVVTKIDNNKTTLRCTLQSIKNENGLYSGNVMFISDIGEFKNIEGRLEMHENMARLVSAYNSPDHDVMASIPGIIGDSPILKELMLVIEQAAPTNAPILILGESGTGKELVAKAVHLLSPRKSKPFVTINCGAIPENLLESELFGHRKGSFTGADRETLGLFREANGGTLFLDEIGEMPVQLQAKLLRVLQEGLVRPVGSTKEVSVDVRIIAATNKNLKELVLGKGFREDLFYRLRVIELVLPPLRMRKADIPSLVFHFLQKEGVDLGNIKISPEAWELLLEYDYPGNIRELENIVQRARVLGGGAILPESLPEDLRFFTKAKKSPREDSSKVDLELPINLDGYLEEIEKGFLIEALNEANGIRKDAAKLLGMNFRSFRYRLKKYDLSEEDSIEANETGLII